MFQTITLPISCKSLFSLFIVLCCVSLLNLLTDNIKLSSHLFRFAIKLVILGSSWPVVQLSDLFHLNFASEIRMMTCPSRLSVRWQRVSRGPTGEPSICLLNESELGVHSLWSTKGVLYWKLAKWLNWKVLPASQCSMQSLPAPKCKIWRQPVISVHSRSERLSTWLWGRAGSSWTSLTTCRDIFCGTACWHALSVGASEPEQPLISLKWAPAGQMSGLNCAVSLTRIILTCFSSHILSPHLLFSSNKFSGVPSKYCLLLKYRSPPVNMITSSLWEERLHYCSCFLLVAHKKLFFFWMFVCSFLTK